MPTSRSRKTSRRRTDFEVEIDAIVEAYDEEGASWEVWAMDEHRIGQKPIIQRVWAKKGQPVIAKVNPKFEWLYLYAFVHPLSGETFWLFFPLVNTTIFNIALQKFAEWLGINKTNQVILVVDQAGWHFNDDVVVPEGLHLLPLPSKSPELQPAERLWELTDEPIANRAFEHIDEIEHILTWRCRDLMEQTTLIKGRTGFHWWKRAVRNVRLQRDL